MHSDMSSKDEPSDPFPRCKSEPLRQSQVTNLSPEKAVPQSEIVLSPWALKLPLPGNIFRKDPGPQGTKRKLAQVTEYSGKIEPGPPDKRAKTSISTTLEGLATSMEELIKDFERNPITSKIPECIVLQVQYGYIKRFKGSLPRGIDVDDHPAFSPPYEIPLLPEEIGRKLISGIELKSKKIAKLLQDIRDYVSPTVKEEEEDEDEDTLLARASRPPYPQIAFYSTPFYHYAQWHSVAQSLFFSASAVVKKEINKVKSMAARLIHQHRQKSWWEKNDNDRLTTLRDILRVCIPGDKSHSWVIEPVDSSIDDRLLVYRHNEIQHLLLAVTVKPDDGVRQTIFNVARKHVDITRDIGSGPREVKSGWPMLFLGLNRQSLFVGGAVLDPITGMSIVQDLPGLIRIDAYNIGEAGCTLWAMTQSLNAVEAELKENAKYPAAPLVGLGGGGITITDMPRPGRLCNVKLDFSRHCSPSQIEGRIADPMSELRAKGLAGNSNNTSYILKAIYPSVNFGHSDVSHVQQTLAESGMAPQLYLEFWPYIPPPDVSDLIRAELSGLMPLVRYLIMERLLPPGPRKPGWQSLRTLAKQEPESAKFHKRTIQDSLNHTLGHLKLKKMVHGDMRPQNIMICMLPEGPKTRDSGLVDLRLIDFSRSVAFKTEDDTISRDDDLKTVQAWMKMWPEL